MDHRPRGGMGVKAEKRTYRKIAYVLSLCAVLLWAALGTGTSLAWFTDTSAEVRNIFHAAEFALKVSHRTPDGSYEPVDSRTQVFDDGALYEPGYTQVVYLKVENGGDLPFSFRTAVSTADYTTAVNVFGAQFNLQDHLRFGLVTASTEAELENRLASRPAAAAAAQMPLNNYASDAAVLEPGGEAYVGLIVRMPEAVGNEANYRGATVPRVELGVIVEADQVRQ